MRNRFGTVVILTRPVLLDLGTREVANLSLNQAAAPQPREIIPNESATTSTGSLIDVDTQSVRTVPSDFMEQSIQTDTQADRVEREDRAAELRAEAARKERAARKKAARADDWVASKIASLSEGGAAGVLYGNAAVVVALGGVLGYQGWGLHQRGVLSWKHAGIGAAVLSTVAVVESVFYRYVSVPLRILLLLSFKIVVLTRDIHWYSYFTKARGNKA